jgi:hypothetical protein
VADSVEEAVLPDDGEDLRNREVVSERKRIEEEKEKHTSSSMRARTRAEPAERRKLWSMKRGLKPARRRESQYVRSPNPSRHVQTKSRGQQGPPQRAHSLREQL